MKLPDKKSNLELPESWDEENIKKAVAVALAATAAAGIYHHYTKNRKGYTYVRPWGDGKFKFEIGMPEYVEDKLTRVRQLFGSVFSLQGDIERLSEGDITVENNLGELSAEEIAEAFTPDPEDSE